MYDRGPVITIRFTTADGLEAEKTRVRYRSVDIGRVTGIAFSKDRSNVIATVELSKQTEPCWWLIPVSGWCARA